MAQIENNIKQLSKYCRIAVSMAFKEELGFETQVIQLFNMKKGEKREMRVVC